jgi:hypothetical protein
MVSLQTIFISSLAVWALSCSSPEKKEKQPDGQQPMPDTLVHQEGKRISQEAFAQLSVRLQSAMAAGGVTEALAVCKVEALPITQQLGDNHGVILKRIATRYRNPLNEAEANEHKLFTDWENSLQNNQEPAAIVLHDGDNRIWYQAIRLSSPNCLRCHGEPEKDIKAADYAQILAAYPEDKATGFALGDIRGAWKIIFPAQKNGSIPD